MSAIATIVGSFYESGQVCLAVRVSADAADAAGKPIDVEYIGRVPLDDAWRSMSPPAQKAAMLSAVKSARDAQKSLASIPVPAMTGQVTI